MRTAPDVDLSSTDRNQLQSWANSGTIEARLQQRATIILQCAEGKQNKEIAEDQNLHYNTVGKWRKRFLEDGIEGLQDKPRTGRPPELPEDLEARILEATLTPPKTKTHWSTRSMAEHVNTSPSTVHRIWNKHDLKPHLVRTFKLSNDPDFEEKVQDIVGLYLDPPENAIVLSVDEKSQIQALERSQPILPIRPGLPEHQTHDYRRHGTTTLFAALNTKTGDVIHDFYDRHRQDEFIQFLDQIDENTPSEKDLHLIVDNYATHKTQRVQDWLEAHPRFVLHFTPTSSSWLNLVERLFAKLTDERIRRGSFTSVDEVIDAINGWLEMHHEDPSPFVWTKTADQILEKVERYTRIYDTLH